jgi:cephalosporin hydroxylase
MALNLLAKKYGTDKFNPNHSFKGLSYCDIYEKYLKDIRETVTTFVEIGIKHGRSLKMFEEYFPNATIYGIDIDPRCKAFETDRIKIFIGDQNDEVFLKKVKKIIGKYDVLLDDGSHITSHQVKTFDILYENLKPKGYYIIEDLKNSYEEHLNHHDVRSIWSGMKYNDPSDPLKNYRKNFVDFVEEHVKELDFHRHETLLSIHHYPMIVIFENI